MNEMEYLRVADPAGALKAFAAAQRPRYLAGGTNLVDLMRQHVERPDLLIDVSELGRDISISHDGTVVVGAGVKNTALASHPHIRSHFPMLSQAILNGASGQIRNMASVGGNILQRTRCYYFYDSAASCNKRRRGSGCDALAGFNRIHAILGTSEHCIATHPSDMCVALAALDARLQVQGLGGMRQIRLTDLHRAPGDTPDVETQLQPDELIIAVEIPPLPCARTSLYRKVRDRASYAFALVSVAAAMELNRQGKVSQIRVALGGVAHKPWRATLVEKILLDQSAEDARFGEAAEAELAAARGHGGNSFKIQLAARLIQHTLGDLARTLQEHA
ncbi:MAG: xanthine dehydrogenase family protein subunit M [Sinobacteraceae bacterium]|nr:xanthine dehydrogenase family protein subunit M [Nevskiaceae bacterium]MBV8852243.1 xanthine dehydrogenase family protein subunit M [Nevskiaceae bacterium]MBV9911880.1 xanthine dehydrogenase family protein subunit M [Nevskiaceae bacterium]